MTKSGKSTTFVLLTGKRVEMKQIVFNTQGTCSQQIILTGDKGRITDVSFIGGCNGNLQGISLLVRGMKYEDVIAKLRGIRCGTKRTSCPDQLAEAVRVLMTQEGA